MKGPSFLGGLELCLSHTLPEESISSIFKDLLRKGIHSHPRRSMGLSHRALLAQMVFNSSQWGEEGTFQER